MPSMQTLDTSTDILSSSQVRELVQNDFDATDQLIGEQLESNVPLIKTICQHIIDSGGKRMRPLLVLLMARAWGYRGKHHITLAAIIEFIHTATLLHDDVVDTSEMRRGKPTANTIWDNAASVLVGDFLYTRVFQLLTTMESAALMGRLANITNAIAEGEMMQLINRNQTDVTEAAYMHVIECKTAKLFEAATELGAMLALGEKSAHLTSMASFGTELGKAFQLIDDALDYSGDTKALGKNVGDDLAEGKATLPLIYAMKQGTPAQKALIQDAIRHGGLDKMDDILQTIHDTNALEYTVSKANLAAQQARDCLQQLPESKFKQGLSALTYLAVSRSA